MKARINDQIQDADLPKDAQQVWQLSSNAMSSKFSQHAEVISAVTSGCKTTFSYSAYDDVDPHTIAEGQDRYPSVIVPYRASPEDFISISHEFGHAVQLAISQLAFIPPIWREVAAFVAEMVALEHLTRIPLQGAPLIQAAWERDHFAYLVEDAENLQTLLDDLDAPYEYWWNYPVARKIAEEIYWTSSPSQLWNIFNGSYKFGNLLEPTSSSERSSEYSEFGVERFSTTGSSVAQIAPCNRVVQCTQI